MIFKSDTQLISLSFQDYKNAFCKFQTVQTFGHYSKDKKKKNGMVKDVKNR